MDPLDKNSPISYLSVGEMKPSEIIIEKSRFLGFACPVSSIEEVELYLEEYRKRYKDASHLCFAYIIGQGGLIMRASDDGEPSGTAGVPILEVLKKENLTDTLVMVVRYFGGTKLGSGGLIRAYSKSAKESIEKSGVFCYEKHYPMKLVVDYSLSGGISHLIKEKNWQLKNQVFTDKVTYHLEILERERDEVEAMLIDFTKNQLDISYEDLIYLPNRR